MAKYRLETLDFHGLGPREHEVYDLPAAGTWWNAVTNIPCPVEGCQQTVVWHEYSYVPGYRVCMNPLLGEESIRHRFMSGGAENTPFIVRDDCCEGKHKDVSGADLREAALRGLAVLHGIEDEASESESALSGADLKMADLRWADLGPPATEGGTDNEEDEDVESGRGD